jgi:hypothetical protein
MLVVEGGYLIISFLQPVLVKPKAEASSSLLIPQMRQYFLLVGFQFFRGPLHLGTGKINIFHAVKRNKMQVSMRHFQADHTQPHPPAGERPFDGPGNRPGKQQYPLKMGFIHVQEFIHFNLGNHQGMTRDKGKGIKKGKKVIILGNLVAGNLTANDFGEYSHDGKNTGSLTQKPVFL